MKNWVPLVVFSLGFWSLLSGQAETPEKNSILPTDSLRRAQEIISRSNQKTESSQAEVMDLISEENAPEEVEVTLIEPVDEVAISDESVGGDALPDIPIEDVAMDLYGEIEQVSLTRDNDTISVDFPDEDVRTIIRNVSDLYELNVVIPESLIGGVSLKLRDVTWRQVFDVVLEPLNYTWVEDGNIIKIKSLDELLAEPVATRVFIIDFATASELSESVSPMVDPSAGGQMQVDVRSNALVITERPSRMNAIQAILERLDRPTDQVMIESKFVEVTRRDEKNLGINWSGLNGYQLEAGPVQREYTNENGVTRTNTLTVQNGTNFDLENASFTAVDTNLIDNTFSAITGESRIDTALFNAEAFSVVLSALENNNEVELVSNPTVVTMNNTLAQINIGEEYPIPQYRYNEENGTFEVSGFEYKPIGILLNVTPQVNSAGFINLEIKPEISSRTGEVNFGGAGGAAIPIVTTRKTESSVTIKSGYTLAIGGLMEHSIGKTENKVPVLGDIPGVGRLFRNNTDTLDGRNLVIFITAKVLNPDGSSYEEVFDDQTLHEMGISDRDLPGFEVPETERVLYDLLKEERNKLHSMEKETELKKQLMLIEELKAAAEEVEAKRLENQAKSEAKRKQ
jgi:type IV pilus assembly protein PilQ